MGSVVAAEVLQKARPQTKPPTMMNGVRLPKRLWQWSDSAPKTRFATSAKIEPTEFMAARTASGCPMLRPLKRSGNRTLEPMVPDIIHMMPKMMKPIMKRHVSVLGMGFPVSGAMVLGSIAVAACAAI